MTRQRKQKKENKVEDVKVKADLLLKQFLAKEYKPRFTLSEIEMRSREKILSLEAENRILRSIVEGLLEINLDPKMEFGNE